MVVSLKAIMITGRTLGQGASVEAKMSLEFAQATSFCALSGPDYASLGLSSNINVSVVSEHGRVVLSPRRDSGLSTGIIFISMGPWANVLVGPDTSGCGTPQFKGVPVEVSPTDEKVLDIRDLFAHIVRRS